MPLLKNPRHEAFAHARAKGALLDDAYEDAGFAPGNGHASRLAQRPEVAGRIAELRALQSDLGEANPPAVGASPRPPAPAGPRAPPGRGQPPGPPFIGPPPSRGEGARGGGGAPPPPSALRRVGKNKYISLALGGPARGRGRGRRRTAAPPPSDRQKPPKTAI